MVNSNRLYIICVAGTITGKENLHEIFLLKESCFTFLDQTR